METKKPLVDIKQIFVSVEGKVRITLEHKTFDDDGLEETSSIEKLSFDKGADVSAQPFIVQKICNDAWKEQEA
jgi:hypothetical protein